MTLPTRLARPCRLGAGLLLCVALSTQSAFGQTPAEREKLAETSYTQAKAALTEKNFPVAIQRYREYLAKFGSFKDAPAARFDLALCLLDGPERNPIEARDLLYTLTASFDRPEYPYAVYNLGLILRNQGLVELANAEGKAPPEAQNFRDKAAVMFAEALPIFSAAVQAFAKTPVEDNVKDIPPVIESAALAKLSLAELLLRQEKFKEVQALTAPFASHPLWSRTRAREQGCYYLGLVHFLAQDPIAAQKALLKVAPFADFVTGPHARYLLARTHHLADEKPEALRHYEGAIADFQRYRAEAGNLLRTQPERFRKDPGERVRFELFLREPIPDHILRATFYLGVLLYENGRFGEALGRFQDFPKLYPNSPLRAEADLRAGFCQVQVKSFAEAVKTLTPLLDKNPQTADQAFFWLGKAFAGLADPANPPQYQQNLVNAVSQFRAALERVQRIQPQDQAVKTRRGEILLEIADTLQGLKQYRDAINTYNQMLAEKALPEREEEILPRLAAAFHLAGDANESDKVCQQFMQKYPRSTLLPGVLFTLAENQHFRGVTFEKTPPSPARDQELAKIYAESIARHTALIEKYPEYPKASLARYNLGMTLYRQNQLDKAFEALNAIPGPDRSGDLALVPYVLADCLLRRIPATVPDDALAAGKMEGQLKNATELLEAFASAPLNPYSADGLIKLGLVHQRKALLLAQPKERAEALTNARNVYQRIAAAKEFKDQPAVLAEALFEDSKCRVLLGDPAGAINKLQVFMNDPLRVAPVAPMAQLYLATLLRGQNRVPEAVNVLAKSREWHEGNLSKDSERAGWVHLLRYHHGVALREAGKLPEARALFELVVKAVPARIEGMEAALRLGQATKEEGLQKLEASRKYQNSKNPAELATHKKLVEEGVQALRQSAAFLENQVAQLKSKEEGQDTRARMLYEAAWVHRLLAQPEIQQARAGLVQEAIAKLGPLAGKFPAPEVPIEKVPVQPAEKKARELYASLIDQFGETPLSTDARFELAELLAQKGEYDAALKWLLEVLDKEPSPELTDRVRLHMGAAYQAKGDHAKALKQFEQLAANPKSGAFGQAHYRAAEVHLLDKQYAEAVKRLSLFRDQGPWQNVPVLSDRAMFRLGFAYAALNDWENSRRAYERSLQLNGNSPWSDEARFGLAQALQKLRQFDPAINVYRDLVNRTPTELAAKSLVEIGSIRREQKNYPEAIKTLLTVPATYGYAEPNAAALYEAGRAHAEANQPAEASKLWERVVAEYPTTPSADAARARLKTK